MQNQKEGERDLVVLCWNLCIHVTSRHQETVLGFGEWGGGGGKFVSAFRILFNPHDIGMLLSCMYATFCGID